MPRYFTLAFLFGAWGAWYGIAWLVLQLDKRIDAPLRKVLTIGAAGGLLAILPWRAGDPRPFLSEKESAHRLASKAPGALLINGYWGSYVYEAHVSPGLLRALPAQGQWDRMSWREHFNLGEQVIVGRMPPFNCAGGQPPETITQYGAQLRLVEDKILVNNADCFDLYLVEKLPPI